MFVIQSPIIFLVTASSFLTLHFLFPVDERAALVVAVISAAFFLSGVAISGLFELFPWYFSSLLVATELITFLMSVLFVIWRRNIIKLRLDSGV